MIDIRFTVVINKLNNFLNRLVDYKINYTLEYKDQFATITYSHEDSYDFIVYTVYINFLANSVVIYSNLTDSQEFNIDGFDVIYHPLQTYSKKVTIGHLATFIIEDKQVELKIVGVDPYGYFIATDENYYYTLSSTDLVEPYEHWSMLYNYGRRGCWFLMKDGNLYIRQGREGDDELFVIKDFDFDNEYHSIIYNILMSGESWRYQSGNGTYSQPFRFLDELLADNNS